MFENDYIKRITKGLGQMLVAIFIGKDAVESITDENNSVTFSEDDLLELMIKKYLNEGKINEAENLIFETLKSHKSVKNYNTSLYFYEEINNWSNDKLAKYNFSKEEAAEGLKDVKKIYCEG